MNDFISLRTQFLENQSANINSPSITEFWNQRSPYDRCGLNTGIVHFGPGRFFRAHLARIIHQTLAQKDLRWGICGVSLKSHRTIATLQPQNFLYTLVERYEGDDSYESANVIGSIERIINGASEPDGVLNLLESPSVHLVTLTITQAGYCLDSQFNLDLNHSDIAHDLENPNCPTTAIGFIVEGLRRRRNQEMQPFTVLSCDNLPRNGDILQRAVLTYANQIDPELAAYVLNHVTFPNTVVDRIVPQSQELDQQYPEQLLQIRDRAPIITEPFWQFVVEDKFKSDRPIWEDTGVTMTDDITPFLHLKSRFLNAIHSFIACLAVKAGIECVHQALRLPEFHLFVRLLMDDIAAVTPVHDSMCEQYIDRVLLRLSNEAIPDSIDRIAAETSRKLGKYIVPILQDAYTQDMSLRRFVLPIAAWIMAVQEGVIKDKVTATIQAGGTLSQIIGLEDCEFGQMVDRDCDRAIQAIRTYGLSATLRQYSQEHFHDCISAA